MQASLLDLERFGGVLKLAAFSPFKSAAHALENANDISEGVVSAHLAGFLQQNLGGKAARKPVLGVLDRQLAGNIRAATGIECDGAGSVTAELARAIRFHGQKILGAYLRDPSDYVRSQLGLGHAYSRCKVKFNVNRSDNMIIQSICLLDQLDRDVNTFAMRVREWYSWHFPELARIVGDPHTFARLVRAIGNRASLGASVTQAELEKMLPAGEAQQQAAAILEAARSSMGTEISELDLVNINRFADRVISLIDYRSGLSAYLSSKMTAVAPNLATLVGDVVGARLISRAGSLVNLSKAPASTVQILGAEKALFRALKAKAGKTPKYGILYNSSFIGKASAKCKGRISRYLANKCSIASRIDCFAEEPSSIFGGAMRTQVEERLKFFETGEVPRTNIEVMQDANTRYEALYALAGKRRSAEPGEEARPKKARREEKGGAKPERAKKEEKSDAKLEKTREKKEESGAKPKKAKKEESDAKPERTKKEESGAKPEKAERKSGKEQKSRAASEAPAEKSSKPKDRSKRADGDVKKAKAERTEKPADCREEAKPAAVKAGTKREKTPKSKA